MIRLSTLTPQSVADEVTGWVRQHITQLAWSLGAPDHAPPQTGGDLWLSAAVVTHYAQTGRGPGDAPITGYLQSVVEALYQAPHPDVYSRVGTDYEGGAEDPEHAIDCVIRAALARDAVERGQGVPLRWLAPLAELSVATLRQYATPARGELRTLRDGAITSAEARRWLGARGVEGYR